MLLLTQIYLKQTCFNFSSGELATAGPSTRMLGGKSRNRYCANGKTCKQYPGKDEINLPMPKDNCFRVLYDGSRLSTPRLAPTALDGCTSMTWQMYGERLSGSRGPLLGQSRTKGSDVNERAEVVDTDFTNLPLRPRYTPRRGCKYRRSSRAHQASLRIEESSTIDSGSFILWSAVTLPGLDLRT